MGAIKRENMEEPSVLDYLKSKLLFWHKTNIEIQGIPEGNPEIGGGDDLSSDVNFDSTREIQGIGIPGVISGVWSLLPLAIVLIGIVAQSSLESEGRNPVLAIILYGLSAGLLVWNLIAGKWVLPVGQDQILDRVMATTFRRTPGIVALILLPISFLLFKGNQFTPVNLLIWLVLILFFLAAFWEYPAGGWQKFKDRVRVFFKQPAISFRITPWVVLVLLCSAVVIYFRLYALNEVPGEMFSDHAEKLIDISGVLEGNNLIFFPRNTGREAIQMYLTAAVSLIAGTGLSFMSLKLGTTLAGLLALPFIYLVGKQVGGKWVGLLALLLSGIAYWPNVISRVGLRFPLYPLFVAPTIYFLIKAFQNRSRNDLLLAGLFLGLGMHGYSPFRIVPFVVVIAFVVYYAFCRSDEEKSNLGFNFLIITLAALIVFLPLMKYLTEDPLNFSERAFSRLGSIERPLPGPPLEIFFNNSWQTLIMFFWDNGNIWVHSVVGRPALDVVTAVFFFMGSLTMVVRFFRRKNWIDLFLLLSIPVLMLPSILSLAFPDENPSLNRTAGAIIPVFVIAGYGLFAFLQTLAMKISGKRGKVVTGLVMLFLVGMTIYQNYDLVFNKFNRQFMAGALNTSEIGSVIKGFDEMGGSPENAYVIPFPYWVDTRLVGINAGFPTRDFALAPENFETTLSDNRMKLFIFYPEDQNNLAEIKEMYPRGTLSTFKAKVQGKDFLTYLVPPN
ncbi:MAG: glycosyltransferase family 39 protein [Anaerolineaceae bacterium]